MPLNITNTKKEILNVILIYFNTKLKYNFKSQTTSNNQLAIRQLRFYIYTDLNNINNDKNTYCYDTNIESICFPGRLEEEAYKEYINELMFFSIINKKESNIFSCL